MASLLHQLYKTKLRLAGLVTAVAGAGLLFVAKAVETDPTLNWPISELGTTLLGAGIIAIIFEYHARTESEALAAERFRKVIRQEAPAIRDAVLDSLAFNPDTLKDVASPETLDRIATNALGLRLDDQELARDSYTDLRDQVIRAPERWRDLDVSVTLSPSEKKAPATGHGSMFVATIRWEYRVTPASSTMRFACTSEHAEYRELRRDPTVTGPWYISRNGGLDAASQDVFELVQVTVNGKPRTIRRTTRPNAQLYTVSLGRASDDEVTISYTYRVLVQRHGHVLYLDLPRPAKGLHVQLNYGGAGIRRINTLDYIASNKRTRVDQTPDDIPAKTINVGFDGWVFPGSGVAFVWVLEEEMTPTTHR